MRDASSDTSLLSMTGANVILSRPCEWHIPSAIWGGPGNGLTVIRLMSMDIADARCFVAQTTPQHDDE